MGNKMQMVIGIISIGVSAIGIAVSALVETKKKIRYDDETIDKMAKAKAKYDYMYAHGTIKD
jgi:cytochrome c biogenesis factor